MISHELKCIFVHIPRCGGTSIEKWLVGNDWWFIEKETKHLLASQARKIYAEHWDEYFKFSVVRHPVPRVRSSLKYADHFRISQDGSGRIDFTEYYELFGFPLTVERDYRFCNSRDVACRNHKPGQVYGNILDVELDYVGRLETLERDMEHVARQLGVTVPFDHHIEQSAADGLPFPNDTLQEICKLYGKDFENFGYQRPASAQTGVLSVDGVQGLTSPGKTDEGPKPSTARTGALRLGHTGQFGPHNTFSRHDDSAPQKNIDEDVRMPDSTQLDEEQKKVYTVSRVFAREALVAGGNIEPDNAEVTAELLQDQRNYHVQARRFIRALDYAGYTIDPKE